MSHRPDPANTSWAGYILRYDEPWEGITGYKYEPWHFRYVGKEYAKEIHDANVPLETWLISHRVEVLQNLLKKDVKLPAAADSFTVKEE